MRARELSSNTTCGYSDQYDFDCGIAKTCLYSCSNWWLLANEANSIAIDSWNRVKNTRF